MNSIDYLSNPVNPERLREAIGKAKKRYYKLKSKMMSLCEKGHKKGGVVI